MSGRAWVKLNVVLQVLSALTIGSAPHTFIVDKATARREDGSVYIPAPTLKGVWRTASCYAHSAYGYTCCKAKAPDEMARVHTRIKSGVRRGGRTLCHVCALYGSAEVESLAYFEDGIPLNYAVNIGVRPGIEVDSYTRTVSARKLYFREVIEPGSLFHTTITLYRDNSLSKGQMCNLLLVLLAGTEYVEAVGLGDGTAKPYIASMTVNGTHARSPDEAYSLLGCNNEEIKRLLDRLWLASNRISIIDALSSPS